VIWVLTEEYNMYDQYGAYFVHAWTKKPTPTELIAHGVDEHLVSHVLQGGGREKYEDHWYNLEEVR
jgi:hypothetical protein